MEASEDAIRERLAQVTADLTEVQVDLSTATLDTLTCSPEESALHERARRAYEKKAEELSRQQHELTISLDGIIYKKANTAYRQRCAYEEGQEQKARELAAELHLAAEALAGAMAAYATGYARLEGKYLELNAVVRSTHGFHGVMIEPPRAAIPKILTALCPLDPKSNLGTRIVPPAGLEQLSDVRGIEPYSAMTASLMTAVEGAISRNKAKRDAENPRKLRKALTNGAAS